MHHSIQIYTIALLAIICAATSNAAPYTPKAADEIIAQWPAINNTTVQKNKTATYLQLGDPTARVALANSYLAQAAQPGQSRLYGLAQATLKPLIDNNSSDKAVLLAWAQVQQHQHNFSIAQAALEKVLQQDPTNMTANLLMARIDVIQENPLAARNACLKLLGSSDLFTVTACSLEANTYLHPEDLTNSYQQLTQLIQHQGLPSDERGTWLIQMLADMAVRNNEPNVAAEWLVQRVDNSSVNYLAQWADVQLILNHPETVLSYLTPVVMSAPEMDDALLLRLALAEQKISAAHTHWKNALTERVILREQRQDILHANELAMYYLDINPNPKKALRYAQINFETAREYNDKKLLARAQLFNTEKGQR